VYFFPAPWHSKLSSKGSGAAVGGPVAALSYNGLCSCQRTLASENHQSLTKSGCVPALFLDANHLQFKLRNLISLNILGIRPFLLRMHIKSG